ncbi:nicotinamide-nucleotide amidohydrolase family protein [Arthrobacter roseus]|uniref:nicotinamide-nucleotide amidohydrolase family protein n=1 Tax=Arthrobacter roseus TaxID=136274 RepID=UPI001962F242|nr:nicotinamide-nucleotide amidase [Arthrobacter roseus]
MTGRNAIAEAVIDEAVRIGATIATAESLTAGMVSSSLGGVPGASRVLLGGVVAYQNAVKSAVLGVDPALLERVGSVDSEVATAMSEGVRQLLNADYGVATTGVAGPQSHDGKAVGTVFVSVAGPMGLCVSEFRFAGARDEIRSETTTASLQLLLTCLRK